MKEYVVHFTGQHKSAEGSVYVDADRYKRTPELYIFYNGDGNVIAQFEVSHVVGVVELPKSDT
jgi:hypothetical protein